MKQGAFGYQNESGCVQGSKGGKRDKPKAFPWPAICSCCCFVESGNRLVIVSMLSCIYKLIFKSDEPKNSCLRVSGNSSLVFSKCKNGAFWFVRPNSLNTVLLWVNSFQQEKNYDTGLTTMVSLLGKFYRVSSESFLFFWMLKLFCC